MKRPFADGEYQFKLAWPELLLLEEKVGPLLLALGKLQGVDWKVNDIAEPIRVALIGGGLTPVEASKLIKSYVRDRPPLENLGLAVSVLAVGLAGEDEQVQAATAEAAAQAAAESQ